MNPFAELRAALIGWADIVAAKPEAARHFRITVAGFFVALMWFLIAVLLSIAAQSAAIGMPSAPQVMLGLVGQGLTLGILAVTIAQTLHFLRTGVHLYELLIPIMYALAFVFVLAVPLTLIGPNVALLAVLGMGVAIYLAAKRLAGLQNGVALALGALCVIVLVVVPNALYILFLQLPSPA